MTDTPTPTPDLSPDALEALALATGNACAYLANEPEVYLALREASAAAQAKLRGLADALKTANTRADAAEALLREAAEVLEPFARAGSLFAPRGDSWDMVVYCPAAGDEYRIVGDDLRAARALADKIGGGGE